MAAWPRPAAARQHGELQHFRRRAPRSPPVSRARRRRPRLIMGIPAGTAAPARTRWLSPELPGRAAKQRPIDHRRLVAQNGQGVGDPADRRLRIGLGSVLQVVQQRQRRRRRAGRDVAKCRRLSVVPEQRVRLHAAAREHDVPMQVDLMPVRAAKRGGVAKPQIAAADRRGRLPPRCRQGPDCRLDVGEADCDVDVGHRPAAVIAIVAEHHRGALQQHRVDAGVVERRKGRRGAMEQRVGFRPHPPVHALEPTGQRIVQAELQEAQIEERQEPHHGPIKVLLDVQCVAPGPIGFARPLRRRE